MQKVIEPVRRVHYVGTLAVPENTPEVAMRFMMEHGGHLLTSVPDGETKDLDYVTGHIRSLRDHPAVDQKLPHVIKGDMQHFGDLPIYTLKDPDAFTPESLNLQYAANARESWKIFQKLKKEYVKKGLVSPDLRFQVGIPSDLTNAFIGFKTAGFDEDHRKPYREAVTNQINEIYEFTDGEVEIQFELPTENVLTSWTARPARRYVADKHVKSFMKVLDGTPADLRVGFHLCDVTMRNRSLLLALSTHASVTLINAVMENWPDGRRLPDFFHIPMYRGDHEPRFNSRLINELRKLSILDSDIRLIMGIVTDKQSMRQQAAGLKKIEDVVGRPVDVAATCGLGRVRKAVQTPHGTQYVHDYDRVKAISQRGVALAQLPYPVAA